MVNIHCKYVSHILNFKGVKITEFKFGLIEPTEKHEYSKGTHIPGNFIAYLKTDET